MRVLICDGLRQQGVKIFQKVKNLEVEVREKIEPEELLDVIPDCDGVVIRSRTKIGRKVIDSFPNLRLIVTRSTGFDHIDIKYAAERNIPVCNVPQYGFNTVAEHAFEEIAKTKVDGGLGSSALELQKEEGDFFRLLRFSNARRDDFCELSRLLNGWLEKEEWDLGSVNTQGAFCPRCRRPLAAKADICQACMAKGTLYGVLIALSGCLRGACVGHPCRGNGGE